MAALAEDILYSFKTAAPNPAENIHALPDLSETSNIDLLNGSVTAPNSWKYSVATNGLTEIRSGADITAIPMYNDNRSVLDIFQDTTDSFEEYNEGCSKVGCLLHPLI